MATWEYDVAVDGRPKGTIYKKHGRYHWFNDIRGTETYNRLFTLADVADHIAHLCRVGKERLTITVRKAQ